MDTAIGTGQAAASGSHAAGEAAAGDALAELPADRVDFCQVFASVDYEYEEVLSGSGASSVRTRNWSVARRRRRSPRTASRRVRWSSASSPATRSNSLRVVLRG